MFQTYSLTVNSLKFCEIFSAKIDLLHLRLHMTFIALRCVATTLKMRLRCQIAVTWKQEEGATVANRSLWLRWQER